VKSKIEPSFVFRKLDIFSIGISVDRLCSTRRPIFRLWTRFHYNRNPYRKNIIFRKTKQAPIFDFTPRILVFSSPMAPGTQGAQFFHRIVPKANDVFFGRLIIDFLIIAGGSDRTSHTRCSRAPTRSKAGVCLIPVAVEHRRAQRQACASYCGPVDSQRINRCKNTIVLTKAVPSTLSA